MPLSQLQKNLVISAVVVAIVAVIVYVARKCREAHREVDRFTSPTNLAHRDCMAQCVPTDCRTICRNRHPQASRMVWPSASPGAEGAAVLDGDNPVAETTINDCVRECSRDQAQCLAACSGGAPERSLSGAVAASAPRRRGCASCA